MNKEKKYKVYWEVSKEAIVKAKDKDEAIDKVMKGDIDCEYEGEITLPPEAHRINEQEN
ncbi:hypothetical protein KY314_01690 [Candidatus Woesearchaeota archaeon]|nr:hypothetical protein [Candidatus Woesearchaeota archaeon]